MSSIIITPASGAGEELSTEMVFVRHGETAWNASHTVQGQLDPELNEAGRQQAVVVAGHLSNQVTPAAVYSSDLRRADETAQIIAGACGVSNVVLNEALRDRHMGYLQGLTWGEARALAKSSEAFRGLDLVKIYDGSDPDSRNQEMPGGGESMNQVNERCVSYLNRIAQEHIGERVVVVTHGAPILGLCRHTDPLGSFTSSDIPNTSVNVFHVSSVTGQWTLERLGDMSHLPDLSMNTTVEEDSASLSDTPLVPEAGTTHAPVKQGDKRVRNLGTSFCNLDPKELTDEKLHAKKAAKRPVGRPRSKKPKKGPDDDDAGPSKQRADDAGPSGDHPASSA